MRKNKIIKFNKLLNFNINYYQLQIQIIYNRNNINNKIFDIFKFNDHEIIILINKFFNLIYNPCNFQ